MHWSPLSERSLDICRISKNAVELAYIDDIVMKTETIEDHVVRIRQVFEVSEMQISRCELRSVVSRAPKRKYVGRVVSTEGIKPDTEPVSKIEDWMPPKNKEELLSYIGFANYYRDFIPFHAAKVQPMHQLFRKNQYFYWNQKHQKSFHSVNQAITDAPTLALPNEGGR